MSARTAIARAPLTIALARSSPSRSAPACFWGPRLLASWRGDQTNQSAADFAAAIGGAPKHADDDHEHAEGDGHDHGAGVAHDHAGHEDATSLELAAQALKNIGYEPFTVALRDFERSISSPAWSSTAPAKRSTASPPRSAAVITKVHVIEGESVASGQPRCSTPG